MLSSTIKYIWKNISDAIKNVVIKKKKCNAFYSNSKAEIIVKESDIDDVFESIHRTILTHIQKSLNTGSGWIIDLVIDNNINTSKCNP